MNLIDYDPTLNILPFDGEVNYFGTILNPHKSEQHLKHLLKTIEWQHDQAIIYGKQITTKRKVAWYGDKNFAYTYSNITKHALPWSSELIALKSIVEKLSNIKVLPSAILVTPMAQESFKSLMVDSSEIISILQKIDRLLA